MLVINYGKDAVQNTYDTLAASDISEYLRPQQSVAIKPNLVVGRPASQGATTHPEVVEGIVLFLREYGIKNISVIESSAIGHDTKQAYRRCGYEELAKKYSLALHDLKNDGTATLSHSGLSLKIHKLALEADFLINVPVLKSHSQTKLTCCLKNMKGCIPDSEKRRYHSLGLHKPIAALNALLKTDYCVVDGICGDLSFEEGGTPVESLRIIAGADPVMVDSYCAGLIGLTPDEIGYLALTRQLGVGAYCSPATTIVELNSNEKPSKNSDGGRIADRYRHLIDERNSCSVCYSALIYALHRRGGAVKGKICIGQGYKGMTNSDPACLGIGHCTRGFARHVPGCPPRAVDILKALTY